ncbi:hypothetical protein DFH27DRAFT_546524 [Peziza echinospora]|nr:hypothetical protein DFH27DRAFT_546524 [Peziza echinospora]
MDDPSSPPLEVQIEPLAVLKQKFKDPYNLYHHLIHTPKAMLISMLLESETGDASATTTTGENGRNPKRFKSKQLAHCVYCHNVYNKLFNETSMHSCNIEHFGELEETGNGGERRYTCCERTCDYTDFWDEDADIMDRPEAVTIGPYCWSGIHHEREIRAEDFADGDTKERGESGGEDEDEEEGVEDFQYADGSVEEIRNAVWWKNWGIVPGPTCDRMHCREQEMRRLGDTNCGRSVPCGSVPQES